jgi:hypothetical protein
LPDVKKDNVLDMVLVRTIFRTVSSMIFPVTIANNVRLASSKTTKENVPFKMEDVKLMKLVVWATACRSQPTVQLLTMLDFVLSVLMASEILLDFVLQSSHVLPTNTLEIVESV